MNDYYLKCQIWANAWVNASLTENPVKWADDALEAFEKKFPDKQNQFSGHGKNTPIALAESKLGNRFVDDFLQSEAERELTNISLLFPGNGKYELYGAIKGAVENAKAFDNIRLYYDVSFSTNPNMVPVIIDLKNINKNAFLDPKPSKPFIVPERDTQFHLPPEYPNGDDLTCMEKIFDQVEYNLTSSDGTRDNEDEKCERCGFVGKEGSDHICIK